MVKPQKPHTHKSNRSNRSHRGHKSQAGKQKKSKKKMALPMQKSVLLSKHLWLSGQVHLWLCSLNSMAWRSSGTHGASFPGRSSHTVCLSSVASWCSMMLHDVPSHPLQRAPRDPPPTQVPVSWAVGPELWTPSTSARGHTCLRKIHVKTLYYTTHHSLGLWV